MNCIACERIDQIKQGSNPHFIRELETSYLVLADNQYYEGFCIHLLKEHHEQLPSLPIEIQVKIFEEVATTAKILSQVFSPVRINYACLGNECHHIHWHIVPRYNWDPEPTEVIWTPSNFARKKLAEPERRLKLIEKIRSASIKEG